MPPAHRLQRTIGNAATVRAIRSQGLVQAKPVSADTSGVVRRQPDTCPPNRHEQAQHRGTCTGIRRERGERARFGTLGPSIRTVTPFQCYVIENLAIAGTDFGVLRELDAIADFMRLNLGATLHVTGFTDCLGAANTNANLRTNRASAVEDHFIAILGVDRSRVFLEFASEAEYLATNDTATGRAANRAVAIYLEVGSAAPTQPQPQGPTPQPTQPTPPPVNPATLTDQQCALQIGRSLGTGWLAALPNCPCTTAAVATENTTLAAADQWGESGFGLGCFHPGANTCFRRDSGAHAQQCCYDGSGNLITSGSGAGTPDFVPSSGTGHQSTDVYPYEHLAWQDYNQFWIPNNGNNCAANPVTQARSCRNFHFLLSSRPATCTAGAPTPAPTPTPTPMPAPPP